MIEYIRDEALPGREDVLARLASHDRDVVLRILTLLCPCRNQCYDLEVWEQTLPIWTSQWDHAVREAAHHALLTVRDRARVDTRSRELLDALASRTSLGLHAYPRWILPQIEQGATWKTAVYPKIATRDVPTLIESLCGDERAIRDAIVALCPTDGRRPSKKVWRAILDERRSPSADTRARAERAAVQLGAHARACGRTHT